MSELVKYGDGLQLRLPADMEFEQWEDLGRPLFNISQRSQWWLGDWVNFGEKLFGEKYSQGIPAGMTIGHLRNVSWVCTKFGPSRRRAALDFGHHKAVAGLPDKKADELLSEAEEENWSVARISLEVKNIRQREKILELGVDEGVEKPHTSAAPFDPSEDSEWEDVEDDDDLEIWLDQIKAHLTAVQELTKERGIDVGHLVRSILDALK